MERNPMLRARIELARAQSPADFKSNPEAGARVIARNRAHVRVPSGGTVYADAYSGVPTRPLGPTLGQRMR